MITTVTKPMTHNNSTYTNMEISIIHKNSVIRKENHWKSRLPTKMEIHFVSGMRHSVKKAVT